MNQEQEQNVEQMTPLDQMIAQDQLQMLKAAIPYASFGLQPSLAILSKWLEGNAFYEIDLECMRKKEKREEMEKREREARKPKRFR